MAQLRTALRSELADARARWENVRAQDRCSEQRLDALDKSVVSAPPTATIRHAYVPFLWNVHSSAWDLANTSPAAALETSRKARLARFSRGPRSASRR
jgi:hypothetical protein